MTKIGRYNLSEISLSRIMLALKVRLSEIPHSIAWRSSLVAQENREKIRTFNNLHQNQRCFIVANGPSLAKTDLQLLEDEITFGLNRIYLYFDKTSFRPSYYLSVNELVQVAFDAHAAEIGAPRCAGNHYDATRSRAPRPSRSCRETRRHRSGSFQRRSS